MILLKFPFSIIALHFLSISVQLVYCKADRYIISKPDIKDIVPQTARARQIRSTFLYFPPGLSQSNQQEPEQMQALPSIQRPVIVQRPSSDDTTPVWRPPPSTTPYFKPQSPTNNCDQRSLEGTCTFCNNSYIPFCATNGITYRNKCYLNCARQICGQHIRVRFEGVCPVPYNRSQDWGYKRQSFIF